MAATHWLTNRGKLLIAQGAWDDDAAGLFVVELLANATGTTPTAIDTEAEIQDMDTVNLLLAAANERCTATNYARVVLSRSNAAQSNGSNWANLDAADAVFTSLGGASNQIVYGGWIAEISTDTNDTSRQLVSVFNLATPIPTNGSNITLTIADLYRLT